MYDNPILYTGGNAKKEDLDRIKQKFHIKIPKRCGNTIWPITVAIRKARFYGQKRQRILCGLVYSCTGRKETAHGKNAGTFKNG